jgi:hypothetical protein
MIPIEKRRAYTLKGAERNLWTKAAYHLTKARGELVELSHYRHSLEQAKKAIEYLDLLLKMEQEAEA